MISGSRGLRSVRQSPDSALLSPESCRFVSAHSDTVSFGGGALMPRARAMSSSGSASSGDCRRSVVIVASFLLNPPTPEIRAYRGGFRPVNYWLLVCCNNTIRIHDQNTFAVVPV